MIKCPCCVYKALFNEPWPEDWSVQPIMGLTDPHGKVIYIADGLSPVDADETLRHEFLHMRGLEPHNEKFQIAEILLEQKAEKLRVRWDTISE